LTPTTTKLPRQVKKALRSHQLDSIKFIEGPLGVTSLEEYQKRVIKTVDENERTAVSACHDVGKSFLMARIAMAFLSKYENSKVITTAPTFNQVERILWSEIRAAHAKAKVPLGGKLNLTDWTFSPDWFALGFTPRNEVTGGDGQGTQSSFQGFHASRLMVIFDEATGIPPNIWTMAEGLLTSAHVKFVAIGNPTSQNSEFFRCFKSPSWAKIYLSCFDSPNLIANGITDIDRLRLEIEKVQAMPDLDARKYLDAYKITRPYLLATKWVVEQARKWGLDHPLTVSKILGKFPVAGDNTLMPLGLVEFAQLRVSYPAQSDRKSIGVDVARFGTDSSVITSLHGVKQLSRKEMFKRDALEVTGEVIAESRAIGGADIIVVDETGVGGGVVDLLKDAVINGALPKNCEIRGVQFGAACESDEDKEKYLNLKARMFGLLAEDIKKDAGLVLLDEAVYLDELPTILYKYNQKGQMVIESKDDYKKRTGRKSPDSADSLALANYGRYDELTIGAFTREYTKERPSTFSGGLSHKRGW
jgi:hypothetical protein